MNGRARGRLNGGVRRIVAMEVVSGLGDGAGWVALTAALLAEGAGPGTFALAAAARLGPRALGSAPAGVLADRADRRRLLVTLDLGRAVAMGGMAVAWAAGLGVAPLLLLFLLSYTLAAPYRPALTAAMPLVAGERDLAAANALVGTMRQVMTFVGPLAAAAAVLVVDSPAAGFAVNAASFAVSALLLAGVPALTSPRPVGVHPPRADRGGLGGDLREGWREVRVQSGLLVITVLVFAMYLVRGAEIVLHILVATDRLGLDASGVGLLAGAVGLGAILALPLVDRVTDTARPAVVLVASVLSSVVPTALLAVLDGTMAVVVALVVVGLGLVVFEVLSIVLFQRLARLDTLGRVFGILNSVSNGARLIGALAAPAMVTAVGLPATLVAVAVPVGLIVLVCTPALFAMERATTRRRLELAPRVAVLAGIEAFAAASGAALERVAGALVEERAAAGDVIVRQGDPADDLYVIRTGRFTVYDGDRAINRMGDGDYFGEIGLLQRRPRTSTVVADTDAELWRIPGGVFLLSLQEHASPPAALMEGIATRLARNAGPTGAVV